MYITRLPKGNKQRKAMIEKARAHKAPAIRDIAKIFNS
jgi:hypothetical protein